MIDDGSQIDSSLSAAMQGKIFSMLEKVISDEGPNECKHEDSDSQFSNFFSEDTDKDSNSSPSNSYSFNQFNGNNVPDCFYSSKNNFTQLFSRNDSISSNNCFFPNKISDLKKSKTMEISNTYNSYDFLDSQDNQNPFPNIGKPIGRSQSLNHPNFNANGLFQINPCINNQEHCPSALYQNRNFVMPLRTFNFKHSYNKNEKHFPQSTKNYIETYNAYSIQGNPNNIVVPLFKNKYNLNKNFSSFDQKCLKLESFLLSKRCFTREIYEEFKDDFIKLLKNQQTSRLCQFFFDGTPDEIVHLIYKEISEELVNLLTDPYANYFILKIFTHLNSSDRMSFLTKISKTLDWLSINKISTYPIQIIIEKTSSRREQELIMNSISKYVIKLSLDVYGTHVVERILINFPYDLIEPISYAISQNFLFLANNPNGLCVIKKIIVIENKRKNHLTIQRNIEENALELVQNPYGNYALQTVLTHWNYDDCKGFIQSFKNNFFLLSTQKYSSNVIEKCFELDSSFLNDFINEVFYNENSLVMLLKNVFGNYVLQTVLKYLEEEETRKKIKKQIELCLEKIHDTKVLYKWKKILNHYFPILN